MFSLARENKPRAGFPDSRASNTRNLRLKLRYLVHANYLQGQVTFRI